MNNMFTRLVCACILQAITLGAIGVAAVADLYDRNVQVTCHDLLAH